VGGERRRQKSLRIGVHLANGVVRGLVYRTHLIRDGGRRRPQRDRRGGESAARRRRGGNADAAPEEACGEEERGAGGGRREGEARGLRTRARSAARRRLRRSDGRSIEGGRGSRARVVARASTRRRTSDGSLSGRLLERSFRPHAAARARRRARARAGSGRQRLDSASCARIDDSDSSRRSALKTQL
jgi:hypothetical protein